MKGFRLWVARAGDTPDLDIAALPDRVRTAISEHDMETLAPYGLEYAKGKQPSERAHSGIKHEWTPLRMSWCKGKTLDRHF